MRNWVIGGALVGFAVVAGQQFFAQPNTPVVRPPEPVIVAEAPKPAAPVVLNHVIDVTDIDALLDPPPEPAGAVASFYEVVDEFTPVIGVNPLPIPPANDDEPGKDNGAKQPDTRNGWYGPDRLPRQLTEVPTPAKDYWLCPPGYSFQLGVYF